MGKRKRQQEAPKPRTAFEYLAAQSGTNAADWRHVARGTSKYRQGFRYWHPPTDSYAKREA